MFSAELIDLIKQTTSRTSFDVGINLQHFRDLSGNYIESKIYVNTIDDKLAHELISIGFSQVEYQLNTDKYELAISGTLITRNHVMQIHLTLMEELVALGYHVINKN